MTAALHPPSPRGRLISGSLPEFRRDRLDFFTRLAQDHGDVVAFRLGPRRALLVSHPDAIEQVLVSDSRHFIKHFALRLNPLVLGNGLLTSEGDFWLRQRRLSQPAFNRQRVLAYGDVMVAYTEQMLAGWQDGQTRDMLPDMTQLTLRIAAKTLFDADVEGEAQEVGDALEVARTAFLAQFHSLIPVPLAVPIPRNLRMRRAVQRLDKILYRFIHQRRAGGDDKGDLLSMLLHAQDDDASRMTDQQLRDEAMTLFLAGHETTALTLAWAWYLLAEHPEAQARLADELQAVLGDRVPTVADLPRLQYVEWVVTESMRLYPPAYVIGREAVTDCEVGGYRVARGRTLFMSQWVVHRDPRWFDESAAFRPERWADGMAGLPKYAYFPFGGGPRLCIGNTFAMMEAVLLLAAVARRFRVTLEPGQVVKPLPAFTLRPEPGVPVVLHRR